MDKAEFMKLQYQTLREEIKDAKARIFKLVGFGIVVVPASHSLSKVYNLEILMTFVPLLVIVVTLLYLSDNHAIMRCGLYIRLHVEKEFPDLIGWERWLDEPGELDPRTVDRYINYCFYVLFVVYYAGSVFLAQHSLRHEYGDMVGNVALGAYMILGSGFLAFLTRNIKGSASTTGFLRRSSRALALRERVHRIVHRKAPGTLS